MYNPVSTYRIQFHKDFGFRSLEAIVPYLQHLGIRTIYASPVFEAVAGSMHGYDGVNPLRINPEIGTEDELRQLTARLHAAGIGWLQDIVPNHMAFDPANTRLMDVLKHGPASRYAGWFDIDWENGGRLMVPVLGDTLENVIAAGDLSLIDDSGHYLGYGGNRYPVKPGAYPTAPDPQTLRSIADTQYYELCHWQETDHRINYRRFFTVNGLICLNIQGEAVFSAVHEKIVAFVREGVFDGLRIDHVDGLYDPAAYLERLRAACGPDCYIVVEKILQPGESIPLRWPIAGTTGYDFLGLVNNLLTATAGARSFTESYHAICGDTTSPAIQAREKKRLILERHMQGELHNLGRLAQELLPESEPELLRDALATLLVQMPVYRYYANRVPIPADESFALTELFKAAGADKPGAAPALTALQELLIEEPAAASPERCDRIAHFYRRLMQYSGPLMAKGVEDTLMYTYSRFIGHNEVGDSPEQFGISADQFHRAMLQRGRRWPLAQNATATHDTKRGEDARALLNALTHAPDRWFAAVRQWQKLNAGQRSGTGPDARDEYFVYQTLFASYPLTQAEAAAYPERLAEYLRKALREAKRCSDWAAPDEHYEAAVIDFATAIIQPGSPFLDAFERFRDTMLEGGLTLALAQLTLKMLAPGVPDVYQGTAAWDLSLVDPDNRRPVDYMSQSKILSDAAAQGSVSRELRDGHVKIRLTQSLLQLRNAYPGLFEAGDYLPLQISGRHTGKALAFIRQYRDEWLFVAVPTGLTEQGAPLSAAAWADTAVQLPPHAPSAWAPITGTGIEAFSGSVPLARLLGGNGIAVYSARSQRKARSAGILMAISSLPGKYAIGDIGPGARRFSRSMRRAGQGFWQVLPLNPVSEGAGNSPYSSISTMAGNTLLISPDALAAAGLLEGRDLEGFATAATDHVDYEEARRQKSALLDLAYSAYQSGEFLDIRSAVSAFRDRERDWLLDFALYNIIRNEQGGRPWYEWPSALRAPGSADAQRYLDSHAAAVERIVWEQALFDMQWRELRRYCNDTGLQLIGDLPFYLSYDSADVWANQHLFSIDADGAMTGVSGVPPDYFSETGQLWGMPTYNWARHSDQEYSWWTGRLRRNLELYDALRIDHFRAFAEYWEVPASESTAVNGKWITGPGTAFFDAVEKALGKLPFIAEDLGDNMEKVYSLRDAVQLPGMKVMQFAFGDNASESVDAPHNYTLNTLCYSGTHDNNTTLGWYRQETGPAERKRIEAYTGRKVSAQNVNDIIARLVYGSVSERAALPMQDVLELDETHRMNTPAAAGGNWLWRMLPGAFDTKRQQFLLRLATLYNRF